MKSLALDIGDRWTGVAISDDLGILARPLTTLKTEELAEKLSEIVKTESIKVIVVGLPITFRGGESDQTRKVKQCVEQLKRMVLGPEWLYWDERLTSKQAARIKKAKTKEEKLQSHAIAAALLLGPYLDSQRKPEDENPD